MTTAAIGKTQNWQALLQLELRGGQDRTRMVPLRRYGPLSVQRAFYPEQDCCHVYLLHPPGGVVGGDLLQLQVQAQPQSHSLLTSPGANKFYRSGGEIARVEQQLEVQANSRFEFLPQENIYFPGARVNMQTRIDVSADSRAMIWEKHCFGRPANHEAFDNGQVITELQLRQDRRLLFTEKQRIDAEEIQRASGLRGQPVIGSLLMIAPAIDDALIDQCRQLQPEQGMAAFTRPLDNLLLLRYLGSSTLELNRFFIRVWELCRPMLLDKQACHPRIWNT
ncbi:MAG: urease accessory protein UreD [Gammaproteobacteria bacterium]|nr:urease accessory protein UreD [Gammaproteobacteria bacterium]